MTDNQREREEISRQAEKGVVAEKTKSTDCGPNEVKATDKGGWDKSRVLARQSARRHARTAAKEACNGGECHPTTKRCDYMETLNSVGGREERPDPSDSKVTQYRYECTSEGTCQCE